MAGWSRSRIRVPISLGKAFNNLTEGQKEGIRIGHNGNCGVPFRSAEEHTPCCLTQLFTDDSMG